MTVPQFLPCTGLGRICTSVIFCALFSTESYCVRLQILSVWSPICCVPWASSPSTCHTAEAQPSQALHLRHLAQPSGLASPVLPLKRGARRQQEQAWDESTAEREGEERDPLRGRKSTIFSHKLWPASWGPSYPPFPFKLFLKGRFPLFSSVVPASHHEWYRWATSQLPLQDAFKESPAPLCT